MRVFVRSRAAVIEAVGRFGGYSESGPFFNVQTETLDMTSSRPRCAIYAVEKRGHDTRIGTHSFQFFDHGATPPSRPSSGKIPPCPPGPYRVLPRPGPRPLATLICPDAEARRGAVSRGPERAADSMRHLDRGDPTGRAAWMRSPWDTSLADDGHAARRPASPATAHGGRVVGRGRRRRRSLAASRRRRARPRWPLSRAGIPRDFRRMGPGQREPRPALHRIGSSLPRSGHNGEEGHFIGLFRGQKRAQAPQIRSI